jgi:1-piperideine-2-carboxylate/1-pyrroline-2-carboxylate reductase [NAD(P)H]
MEYLDAQRTAALLPYPPLAQQIALALADLAQGKLRVPERLGVPLGSSDVLLLMPAVDPQITVVKLVTVHNQNATLGLPTIQGEVMALETQTGRRLALWDGATITGRRTAALSLLAAQTLAPQPEGALLIIGAGTQARTHLEAFQAGLGTQRVFITSRNLQRAQQLVEHAQHLGLEAQLVQRPEEALDQVSLVVAATTSPTPVLTQPLRPQMMVCAVGSFTPDKAELGSQVFAGAQVVVDLLEAAHTEAGDVIQAVAAGTAQWDRVRPLLDCLRTAQPATGPVVFKSVGHAAFDLAAARLILQQGSTTGN